MSGGQIRRKPKGLNKDYNLDYNLNRKKVSITFDPHVFDRKEYWSLDLDRFEEAVRTGKMRDEKCGKPNKVCFENTIGISLR